MRKNNLTLIISFLLIIFISCKEKSIDQLCSENGFADGILFQNLDYQIQKGKLYLYKENSDFNELVTIKDSVFVYIQDTVIILQPRDNMRFSLDYNYRLVLDDTICFDLSNFVIKADTAGRTMGGWYVTCGLASYQCNNNKFYTTKYDCIAPPFNVGRIIKKGQYDQ